MILFVVFMDRISWCSWSKESVWHGNLGTASLLFTDNLVLLASPAHDLQQVLQWFVSNVKETQWQLASQSLRPWFSARKGWIIPSGLGVSYSLHWRSLSNLGSCLHVTGKWRGRWTGSFGMASAVVQALYQTVHWPKEWGPGYKWLKWVSSEGRMGPALDIEGGAWTSVGRLQYSCCSLTLNGAISDSFEDLTKGYFTWRKFSHQMKHFCCSSALLLHENSMLAPLKPQTFENRFQSGIFWNRNRLSSCAN